MKKYILLVGIMSAIIAFAPTPTFATHECADGSQPNYQRGSGTQKWCSDSGKLPPSHAATVGTSKKTVEFVSLSGIEELTKNEENGGGRLVGFVNLAFKILITVSAMLAVIFIAIAGLKYMTSSIGGNIEKAKSDIWSVLVGLFIILASVLILKTINPCLVEFNILTTGNNSCEQR
jgi:hypothetical protein